MTALQIASSSSYAFRVFEKDETIGSWRGLFIFLVLKTFCYKTTHHEEKFSQPKWFSGALKFALLV